jgi:hypothetical protein
MKINIPNEQMEFYTGQGLIKSPTGPRILSQGQDHQKTIAQN